jgi:response regulator of citrate/malate metabolism
VIRTLVVEDEPVLARAHQVFVDRVPGFGTAGVAPTGAAALGFLAAHPADLVLLDFFLPDIDGLEVCRRIRQAGHDVDVIAVTSARDLSLVRGAVSLGVVQYVLKPFSFAVLRDKLTRYAAYRTGLEEGGADLAVQSDVDRLLAPLREPVGGATDGLPKGLAEQTWLRAVDRVRGHEGEVSASDLAVALEISRVTARRYLEHLADRGLATRRLRHGKAGRPEQLYRWAGRS